MVHVAGAVEELADVKAREGTDDKADFGEDAETAADAIGNVEDGPARFLGQAVEQCFFFAAVVGSVTATVSRAMPASFMACLRTM